MILASSLDLGKVDTLANLADDLTAFVHEAVQKGASFDDFERGAFGRLLKMGRVAADLFLDAQGEGDLGRSIATQEGAVLRRRAVRPSGR